MRVLIAGCGYLGNATAELFHAGGWEVMGWTASALSAERLALAPYPVRAVDLTDRAAIAAVSGPFDVVVQCVSTRGGTEEDYRRIYFDGAQNLLDHFPDALLLFTSSTSVYAQTGGEWVTEDSPAEPKHASGKVLRETEELVIARGGIVARIAGIYGPGRSALLRKFLAGEAVMDREERFINQAHRDDIAAALLLLATKARHREIFNVADGHPLSVRACYERLAAALQKPLPPESEKALPRKRGNSNKRVSAAKLHALGWAPRYPTFQAGLSESVLPHLGRLGA